MLSMSCDLGKASIFNKAQANRKMIICWLITDPAWELDVHFAACFCYDITKLEYECIVAWKVNIVVLVFAWKVNGKV